MDENILESIKELLPISSDVDAFDNTIMMHINTVFFTLHQLGVGPKSPYSISTGEETWEDFLGNDLADLEAVKTYVYMKVKIVFDPPTNSSLLQALKELIAEYEWRLNVAVDPKLVEED